MEDWLMSVLNCVGIVPRLMVMDWSIMGLLVQSCVVLPPSMNEEGCLLESCV